RRVASAYGVLGGCTPPCVRDPPRGRQQAVPLRDRWEYGLTHTTLRRRLLAGVAGLAIGISGALALSLPAQAGNQHDKGHQQDGPRVTTKHVTECDGLKIKLFAKA